MNLNLYNTKMERIAIIGGRFVSCMWSEGYNTTQPFTLELQATGEYKSKVKPDCYIGRDDRKTLMVIKTVRVKDGHIIADGKEAKRCLDDVACEATIPEGSNLAQAIKSAYDSSGKFENIEFASQTLPVTYEHQISNKTCWELCEIMCQDTDTGYRVVRSGREIKVEFYRPEANPNRVLAERYGSLKVDAVTLSTENKKNVAVVLGDGEGEARTKVRIDLSGDGEQKRAMFVDARDVQREETDTEETYKKKLAARGYEQLLTKQGTWECALNPLPQEFGTLYDLGDMITVLLPDYGMKLQARITRLTQQSQNNIIDTILEVGDITIMR